MVNQTSEWEPPGWLKTLLSQHPEEPMPYRRAENSRPLAGEIRVAVNPSGSGRRMVLVLRDSESTTLLLDPVSGETATVPLPESVVEVCLLSDDVQLATDTDYVLAGAETGLPFDLLAVLTVRGIVWESQLEPVLGLIEPELLDMLTTALRADDFSRISWDKRGMPLVGRGDARWGLRAEFVEEIQSLASDATATALRICDEFEG